MRKHQAGRRTSYPKDKSASPLDPRSNGRDTIRYWNAVSSQQHKGLLARDSKYSLRHGPRIGIPVPCATNIASGIYALDFQSLVPEPFELIDAPKACANDEPIEIVHCHGLCLCILLGLRQVLHCRKIVF